MTDDRPTAEEKAVIEAAMALHRAKTNPPGTHGGVAILDKARRDFEDATLALYVKLTPPKCEPPEGMRGHQGQYWLSHNGRLSTFAWLWTGDSWRGPVDGRGRWPEQMTADGYSCHSPCLPPGSEPEKVEISDEAIIQTWIDIYKPLIYPGCAGPSIIAFARAVLARFTLPAMTDEEIKNLGRRLDARPTSWTKDQIDLARIVRGEKVG